MIPITLARIALPAIGGAIVGAGTLIGLGALGNKTQTQQARQEGNASVVNDWNVIPGRGGTVTINYPGSANVKQNIDQDQKQTDSSMMNMLVIGIIAIGGLMLFMRGKK